MKLALILEQDPASREHLVKLMGWLGYMAAPVKTPAEALSVVSALSFDVIVTAVARHPDDRRALTGELKKFAPTAPIIFVAANDEEYRSALAGQYAGVSAVLRYHPSIDAMRKVFESQIDGFGIHARPMGPVQERRRLLKD